MYQKKDGSGTEQISKSKEFSGLCRLHQLRIHYRRQPYKQDDQYCIDSETSYNSDYFFKSFAEKGDAFTDVHDIADSSKVNPTVLKSCPI